MGSIRKKTFTKPLPPHAEVVVVKGETVAKVKPPKGRAVTYRVTTGKDGMPKIVGTFVALSPQTRLCGCWMLRNDARCLKLSRAVNEKGSLSLVDSEPFAERVKGIGPSSKAWEAFVLPLNHTRLVERGADYVERLRSCKVRRKWSIGGSAE